MSRLVIFREARIERGINIKLVDIEGVTCDDYLCEKGKKRGGGESNVFVLIHRANNPLD